MQMVFVLIKVFLNFVNIFNILMILFHLAYRSRHCVELLNSLVSMSVMQRCNVHSIL